MRRPDVARPRIARTLSPGNLRATPVIYRHAEVVTIGQAKAARRQVAVACNVARYSRLTAPRGPTIAG